MSSASDPVSGKSVEQAEEEKLRQKYPNLLSRQGIGTSVLQKRLNKGHKYFDSGDYNMAKARAGHHKAPLPATAEKELLRESTGGTMATPDNVPAVRKKSTCPHPAADQHQVTHPAQPVVLQHQEHQQHQVAHQDQPVVLEHQDQQQSG